MPIVLEAGWVSVPVWTVWMKDKSLNLVGIRTPDRPARSLVTTPNVPFRLSLKCGFLVLVHTYQGFGETGYLHSPLPRRRKQ